VVGDRAERRSPTPFPGWTMKTILVVDDEEKIVVLVRDYLEKAGYSVRTASDGLRALDIARSENPDLVVLDLGLPGMDGLDITRELRHSSDVPIIMLTARGEESDKLVGLELGADDYLTKPFSPKELVARVRVVFRRMESVRNREVEVIRLGDLTMDLPRMRVTAEGREIEELTPSEFQLLAAMARQPGRVFTRSQLLDALHGVAFESYERAIDAHIKNIRRKIEVDSSQPRYILTVYGVGYRFSDRVI
jgi:two-component system alkaline phosphatase synthesis response regulator PhoP